MSQFVDSHSEETYRVTKDNLDAWSTSGTYSSALRHLLSRPELAKMCRRHADPIDTPEALVAYLLSKCNDTAIYQRTRTLLGSEPSWLLVLEQPLDRHGNLLGTAFAFGNRFPIAHFLLESDNVAEQLAGAFKTATNPFKSIANSSSKELPKAKQLSRNRETYIPQGIALYHALKNVGTTEILKELDLAGRLGSQLTTKKIHEVMATALELSPDMWRALRAIFPDTLLCDDKFAVLKAAASWYGRTCDSASLEQLLDEIETRTMDFDRMVTDDYAVLNRYGGFFPSSKSWDSPEKLEHHGALFGRMLRLLQPQTLCVLLEKICYVECYSNRKEMCGRYLIPPLFLDMIGPSVFTIPSRQKDELLVWHSVARSPASFTCFQMLVQHEGQLSPVDLARFFRGLFFWRKYPDQISLFSDVVNSLPEKEYEDFRVICKKEDPSKWIWTPCLYELTDYVDSGTDLGLEERKAEVFVQTYDLCRSLEALQVTDCALFLQYAEDGHYGHMVSAVRKQRLQKSARMAYEGENQSLLQ